MTIKCLQGMLTIEAFIDENSQLELLLSQDKITQLNLQISKELSAILPQLDDTSYAVVGALYQSSELLQPGFPIHTQLRQYVNAALKGENNRRNQLIIGTNNKGKIPRGLKQNTSIQFTPLLLLPFVILSDNDETKELFENQLMHKGMGSTTLLQAVQNAINVKVRHVNFMTVLDLAAMMHNHLQVAGFEPLWQLLEQTLFDANPETKVVTPQLNEFYLSKKIVFSPFFSYAFWSTHGPGKDLPNAQEQYLHYIQVQRQYIATLSEHGLDVRQFSPTTQTYPTNDEHICFATLDKNRIIGDFYHEIVKPLNDKNQQSVDKNEHQHLGVLFYQVTDESDGLEFYYPLTAKGIVEIEKIISPSA